MAENLRKDEELIVFQSVEVTDDIRKEFPLRNAEKQLFCQFISLYLKEKQLFCQFVCLYLFSPLSCPKCAISPTLGLVSMIGFLL